jgi:hypothetical protein
VAAQAVAAQQRETVVALTVADNGDHRLATVHGDVPRLHDRQPGQREIIEVERPNVRF